MKKQTHLNSPSPFPLSSPIFAQTVAIAIVIAVHPDDQQQRMRPALSLPPPPAARGGGGGSGKPRQSRKCLAVAACKSSLPAYTH